VRVESGTMPQSFRISVVGETAYVEFAENVAEIFIEEGKKYAYDSYILKTRPSKNLERRISEKYQLWLGKAKSTEIGETSPTSEEILQAKLLSLETRLAKVEAVPLVKTALEPIIKEPIISK